jgi:hypothetical protein
MVLYNFVQLAGFYIINKSTHRDLWTIRLYYFTWLGGGGLVAPFPNLFLARQNLG